MKINYKSIVNIAIATISIFNFAACRKVEIPINVSYPDLYINLQHSGTTENLRAAHFFSADTGLVVGTLGGMYKTVNGGRTWTKSFPIPQDTSKTLVDTTVVLNRIYFQNKTTGWLLGTLNYKAGTATNASAQRTVLRKTTDGGKTWVNKDFNITLKNFTKIAFYDENIGYVIGNAGLIYRTNDGGNTWNKQESGVTSSLTGISILDVNNALICGTNGVLLKTTGGGNSWLLQSTPSKRAFKNMAFVNGSKGFITGGGSNNGGPNDDKQFVYQLDENGRFIDVSITAYSLFYFNDIHAFDENNVWTAGHLGQIYRTIDGGKTWSDELSKSTRQEHLYDISFPTTRIGYFVGDGGVILKADLDKE